MHSSKREKEIFKILIGLSLFTVFALFNNCSGKLPHQEFTAERQISSEAD